MRVRVRVLASRGGSVDVSEDGCGCLGVAFGVIRGVLGLGVGFMPASMKGVRWGNGKAVGGAEIRPGLRQTSTSS